MSSGFQDAMSFHYSPAPVYPDDPRWVRDEYKPNWWDEDTEHTHHQFDWLNQKPAPVCECGVWATYGKEYPKHLEYCPIYQERFDLSDWW